MSTTMTEAILHCDAYLRRWLPARLSEAELRLLQAVGVPVAIRLRDGASQREWRLLAGPGGLEVADGGDAGADAPACSYAMDASTFLEVIAGRRSPQAAFFLGRLRLEGDKLLAIRLGSLLEAIFRRIPCPAVELSAIVGGGDDRTAAGGSSPRGARSASDSAAAAADGGPDRLPLTPHQRDVLGLHLDRERGSRWWIEAAESVGLRADDFHTLGDLSAFGPFDRDRAAQRSWRDFTPRAVLDAAERGLILAETGGTTGAPLTIAWTDDDFERAFVDPLPRELSRRGIHGLCQWLFVGPSGPHIIGKAADALARRTTGIDALKIDFDPRWHRRLAPGSAAVDRHLDHLADQAVAHLRREVVDALFVTPSLLRRLLLHHRGPWIGALRVVHLGGQSVSPEEMESFRESLPAQAALINGYGNSLFGCLVESAETPPLHYESPDDRLVLTLRAGDEPGSPAVAEGEWGRVVFHRFDRSAMLLNVVERDEARRQGEALVAPRPIAAATTAAAAGIY